MKKHLWDMAPGDLVVIEGVGNGLEEIGGRETAWWMEEIIGLMREKINKRPLVMCIPMRQDKTVTIWPREVVGKHEMDKA